jgi:hypothetical protein
LPAPFGINAKLWIQQAIDGLFKAIKRLCPNNSLSVNGKSGCRLQSQLPADIGLVFDRLSVFLRVQAGIESLGIQTHIRCKTFQVVFTEGTLVLSILVREEIVMVFPEGILITGTLSSFCCPLRLVPKDDEVEISKTNLPRIYICGDYLTTRVSGKTPAKWSLIIAEFDHRNGCIGVTLEMGRMADEVIHQLLLAVNGCHGRVNCARCHCSLICRECGSR